jgi:hypothetical protein
VISTITAHTIEQACAFIEAYDGKRNLYYTVNPTKGDVSKKPSKAEIAAVEYLLGDLDPKDDESAEDAKARYLGQLDGSFEPKPTTTVDSGNGIQCLWRLAEPIVLGDDRAAVIAGAEARSAALMARLGAKAGTQNIDRILRLPGTINLPNEVKRHKGRVPCPAKLIQFSPISYPLEMFAPGSPDDGGHHARQRDDETDAHASRAPDEGDRLERIIRKGENGEFNGDRSSAVWWAVNEMLRCGYPDAVIVSSLLDHANKISDHVYAQRHPREYVVRQVNKAKEQTPRPTDKAGALVESLWYGETPAAAPPALIKGVLPQTGVATIGGQSGSGKTFHAIHLAVRLIPDCKQQTYIDRYRIKRHGGVLYLVLEGKPAFPMRVTAAFEDILGKEMKFGDRAKLPFSWNTYEPNLYGKGPGQLIRLAQRDAAKMRQDFGVDLVAIFLDTVGLAACYENEDKAAQVQRVVSGLFKLSDETGALVIGVDHYGKDQSAGLRGSSAKRGHVETILSCLVDRDKNDNPTNHRLKFEKIRDGEEGRVVPYRLSTVDWGIDEDGDKVSTCVVRWEPNRAQPKKKVPERLKTSVPLDQAIKEVGLPADVEVLREAFCKYHGGSAHAANAAWHRAIDKGGLGFVGDKLDYTL